MSDLDGLKALAERATPGPWVTDNPNREMVARLKDGVYHYIADCRGPWEIDDTRNQQETNATYIAAADPTTVLALIGRIADLETTLRTVRRSIVMADPEVLADTLWTDGTPCETVVDFIDAALEQKP